MTPGGERAAYIAGLRQLADVLEQHPQIPVPSNGEDKVTALIIGFHGGDARERMADAVRAFPCSWTKGPDGKWMNLDGQLGGLHIQLYGRRDQVCTRRVTGTEVREVEVEVTPAVTRTEKQEVKVVEWDCAPVLGGGQR